MVTLTKGHGLKEILNCPLMILLLLQNVGEIILITKLLMLLRIYGKIIISWVARDRISVFGPRPYSDAIAHLRVADHCNPRRLLIPGKTPTFQPILYCRFCNQYAIYHEHECDSAQSPFDPFDGYPSDAPSTD